MNYKVAWAAFAMLAGLSAPAAWGAPAAQATAEPTSLSQCVTLRTTGADRLLTARWLFAVMAKSPQIADLAAVTPERTDQLNKSFARLLVRIVNHDCIDQVRPLAIKDTKDAFGQVGRALGETAMGELLGAKEVDKGVTAYIAFLSKEDFRPLMESLPKTPAK